MPPKTAICGCGAAKTPGAKACLGCFEASRQRFRAVDGKKLCKTCERILDVGGFNAHPSTADRLNLHCRDCQRGISRAIRWTRVGFERELRYWYGITVDEWERMYVAQHGTCAACARKLAMRSFDSTTRWIGEGDEPNVDHDHETGAFRGLLCRWCNVAVSKHMSPDALRKCADYLERCYARGVTART